MTLKSAKLVFRKPVLRFTGFALAVTCILSMGMLLYSAQLLTNFSGTIYSLVGSVNNSLEISCYDFVDYNGIQDVTDYPPSKENLGIFFHETSCASSALGDFVFSPRQACAVESAAKTNPDTEVTLLFLSPIKLKKLSDTKNVVVQALLAYSNIKLKHVNIKKYVKGTPLENWYASGALQKSLWPVSHASDVMRYLTLWKYGGTYLDLDVVMLKSISGLTNFAGAQTSVSVGAGVINLDTTSKGRWLANAFLHELYSTFDGNDWGYNGPGVITRVLEKTCGVSKIADMTSEKCEGFTVHPPSNFYPVPYHKWMKYFTEVNSNATMKKLAYSYSAHVWNRASINTKVNISSRQPYGLLAAKYCPLVYATCGVFF